MSVYFKHKNINRFQRQECTSENNGFYPPEFHLICHFKVFHL